MKIAELSTRYPPGPGGVERHVREISTRLALGGDPVGVFTTDLKREFPWQRLDASVPGPRRLDGVTIHRLRAFSLPGELHYPFVRGLEKALARDRPRSSTSTPTARTRLRSRAASRARSRPPSC